MTEPVKLCTFSQGKATLRMNGSLVGTPPIMLASGAILAKSTLDAGMRVGAPAPEGALVPQEAAARRWGECTDSLNTPLDISAEGFVLQVQRLAMGNHI